MHRMMLFFDRLGFSLILVFLKQVHYTDSSSILIQVHNCLECLGLSLVEYARYSHLLLFPPFVLYIRMPAIQTLEPRSRSTLTAPTTTSRPPVTRTRSSLEVPRQEACAFSIVIDICASLLKANMCTRVCTQILLLPLTCVSRAVVFEPSWPLACNIKLEFIYL